MCILLLLLSYGPTKAENVGINDTFPTRCKKIWVSASLSSAAIGSQAALYSLWYTPYNSGSFHFFNDWNEWGKMDKLGHAYSAFALTSSTYDILYWSGFSKNKSLLIAATASWAYQGFIEVMDGFSDGWGFSVPDLLFNSIGTGLFVLDKKFGSSVILPKFSYSPSSYAQLRPKILGANTFERVLKDYNGQTYWLGIKPTVIIPSWKAKWLMISIGYSINERLIGDQSIAQIDGRTYTSHGQLVFSLDIDPRELPIRNKVLKKLFYPLKFIKIPFPAFSIEKGKGKFYPLYF